MIIKKMKEGKDYTDKFLNNYEVIQNNMDCIILEMNWEKGYILAFSKKDNFQEFIVWILLGDGDIKDTYSGKYFRDCLSAAKYYNKIIK